MNTIQNLFQFLGMVGAFATAIFAVWYYWIVPKDWKRARNAATFLSLFFIVVFCPYLYIKNADGVQRLEGLKAEFDKKQEELKKLSIQNLDLYKSLDNKKKTLDSLGENYIKLKTASDVSRSQLLKSLQTIHEIQTTNSDIKIKITNLCTVFQNELLEQTRWTYVRELLKQLGRVGPLSFVDPGDYVIQLKSQVDQIHKSMTRLSNDLETLKASLITLDDRLTHLHKDFMTLYEKRISE